MIVLLLSLGTAIAQTQPSPTPKSKALDKSVESSAEHVYGPKDGAKPPKLIHRLDPEYPEKVRNRRKEGTVILLLVVGSNGLPREIKVERSLDPDLDEAATNAVKWAPATKDGKPVAVLIHMEVTFKLY